VCNDYCFSGPNVNQGTYPDPAYDNLSFCPYCGTRLPERTPAPAPEDERLIVIDLGGGLVHGVETNIPELQGVKVVVLADRKDGDPGRDEIVIAGIDRIVYQTERVAISDCTWLMRPLAQYESQKADC